VRLACQGAISPSNFIALCAAARAHGNGIIEITRRGSVQVRGLTSQSVPLFASQVAALDVGEDCGIAVIADTLVDDREAIIDANAAVFAVRAAIEAAGFALAPKVAVVIDSGGRLHLDALSADVRLRAFGPPQAPRWQVALGGDACSAQTLGAIAPDRAVSTVVRLLATIAAHGRTARASDVLRHEGLAPFRAAVGEDLYAAPLLPARAPADPVGAHWSRDGRLALGIAPAFGQASARLLAELARAGADRGLHGLCAAPGRALLLRGLDQGGAVALGAAAERLGFIVRSNDPRRRIAACPGKPACASGRIAARVLAGELARRLPASAQGIDVHISGCAKGCAHPASAAVTVVGSERGCGIVEHGSARSTPRRYVESGHLITEIVHKIAPCGAAHG
jgi:precorrin-3B synthase